MTNSRTQRIFPKIFLSGVSLGLGFLLVYPCQATAENEFIGSQSCSTSGCHGGAGDMSKQYTIWFRADAHSRAYSTLTTARSQRMAETLKIGNAAQSQRCTTCHAPFASRDLAQPLKSKTPTARPEEGVSCESCHGSAANWVRSHTRTDYTRAQRIHSGMRDLEDLYLRTNTCVACHQVIEPELIDSGHPRLHFDLTGLSDREPRHWKEIWENPQLWVVGQFAALREMSGHLARKQSDNKAITPYELADWESSLRIARMLAEALAMDASGLASAQLMKPDLPVTKNCDQLTKSSSTRKWEKAWTNNLLQAFQRELLQVKKEPASEAKTLYLQKLENGLRTLGFAG
jgi:nitrate/TMAO reductase-like tetraheme cytochrome c subunit